MGYRERRETREKGETRKRGETRKKNCYLVPLVYLRLLTEVGKRVRGKGERANKNPFPFNLFPFPPLVSPSRHLPYISCFITHTQFDGQTFFN
jgi:hypothetical protein